MKILVTGGAGYLGSVLVPMLISEGYHVDVIDIQQPISGNWVNRDIFHNPITERDLESVDAVIHLAAIVGDAACNKEPQRAVEVNYLATKYLSQACKKAGIKLIFASTCSVYGVKNELCKEDCTDPEPFSLYGITKLKAESDVLNAKGVVLRMGTIYGSSPKMRYDLVVNEFVRKAKVDKVINVFGGSQMRPFLEIKNAANVYLQCLKLDISEEIFNIVDENITILKLAQIVQEIFKCEINILQEIVDKRSYMADPSKAIKTLNFRPRPIKEGIEEMKWLSL